MKNKKLSNFITVIIVLIYVVSPIDLIPYCPIDDAIAIAVPIICNIITNNKTKSIDVNED